MEALLVSSVLHGDDPWPASPGHVDSWCHLWEPAGLHMSRAKGQAATSLGCLDRHQLHPGSLSSQPLSRDSCHTAPAGDARCPEHHVPWATADIHPLGTPRPMARFPLKVSALKATRVDPPYAGPLPPATQEPQHTPLRTPGGPRACVGGHLGADGCDHSSGLGQSPPQKAPPVPGFVGSPASHGSLRGQAWAGSPHLRLHEHGHVHEHLVQLADAGLQLQDVLVAGLDLVERLPGDVRI